MQLRSLEYQRNRTRLAFRHCVRHCLVLDHNRAVRVSQLGRRGSSGYRQFQPSPHICRITAVPTCVVADGLFIADDVREYVPDSFGPRAFIDALVFVDNLQLAADFAVHRRARIG